MHSHQLFFRGEFHTAEEAAETAAAFVAAVVAAIDVVAVAAFYAELSSESFYSLFPLL